ELGLNGGYLERFVRYTGHLLTGDMGICYATKQPVATRIAQTFPNSLKLAGAAVGIAVVLGMVLGIISAVKQYSVFDHVAMFLAMIG
ncbi:MAG: ABC transporter permease, partial [Oscillospiraceae bacterium]